MVVGLLHVISNCVSTAKILSVPREYVGHSIEHPPNMFLPCDCKWCVTEVNLHVYGLLSTQALLSLRGLCNFLHQVRGGYDVPL